MNKQDYPPLPDLHPIWRILNQWDEATGFVESADLAAEAQEALEAALRAYVDADRALREQAQPERKPMHEGEIQAAWLGQNIDEPMPYTFVLGIRSAERFNGIKEKP